MTIESYRPRASSRLTNEIVRESKQYFSSKATSDGSIAPNYEKKFGHLQKDMYLFQIDESATENPIFVVDRKVYDISAADYSIHLTAAHLESARSLNAPHVRGGVRTKQEVRFTSLSKLHSGMWIFLVLLALVWGVITGASFFGGLGLGPSAAAAGFCATIALAITMYFVGTRVDESKREF